VKLQERKPGKKGMADTKVKRYAIRIDRKNPENMDCEKMDREFKTTI
jgi:hypothetical protein